MSTSAVSARPLKVLIIGAGIGGLTAAVALRAQGHECIVFERTNLQQETGAAIHIAPNCYGLLKRFGIKVEDIGGNDMEGVFELDYKGNAIHDIYVGGPRAKMWQHPWKLVYRVRLHQALLALATAEKGEGTPVVVHASTRVSGVNPVDATIQLNDGTSWQGDIVLGADGVGSICRSKVKGGDALKPYASGKSAYRFLISRQALYEDPKTRSFVEKPGYLGMVLAKDRRVVMYPCEHNSMLNFVCIHPSDLSDTRDGDWNQEGSKENLLRVYQDFAPEVQLMLGKADAKTLKVWPLLDMEQMQTWTTGRLALLGDAAHPFLPHQGQGAAAAVEDAVSIAALLPRGTPVEQISERFELYENCRKFRAHKIQAATRQTGLDVDDPTKPAVSMADFNIYNFNHDEWHHSKRMLNKHTWSNSKSPCYHRMPIGFGPAQSPRQSLTGSAYDLSQSSYTTGTIQFRTSKTFLESLLPTDAFRFSSPSTVAEASFVLLAVDNLPWLAGGGYNVLQFLIHGIEYQKKDGTTVNGSYLAVLFESSADPIVTGREELGMPKMFADIDILRNDKTLTVRASWRGKTFALLDWADLQPLSLEINGNPTEAERAPSGPPGPSPFAPKPDRGQLSYKYIPAVGRPGVADVEYAVFLDKSKGKPPTPEKRWKADMPKLNWDAHDSSSLPTLHHVVKVLQEIEVFDVVKSDVESGLGVDDLRYIERIE